jgi:hypothetical protein
VTIPIERVEDTTNDVEVCVESGPGRRIVLYGQGGAVRFQWLREGRESWVATIPTIAHRFGLGKAISGAWLLAFAAALLLAAWVLALRLLTREPRA